MKTTAILIMIITIFSKLLGFIREIVLSYFYGASNISDAYVISLTVPTVIFGIIGVGIFTGYIPMYSKIVQKGGEKEGNRYTSNLINIVVVMCTFIIIFGFLCTDQLVKIFASGFEGDTLALAIRFTRISLLGIYFTGIIYIFNGFLQIKGNYIIPALVGFPFNFFVIVSIFLSSKTNILVLSIGTIIATASQLVLILPFIFKKRYRHRFIFNIKNDYIKNTAYNALPIILGTSVSDINKIVDRTIASQIAVGGISALNYAAKLNGFIQGIFVMSIATVLYPIISKMAAEDNIQALKKLTLKAICSINILVIPVTIGSMLFAEQIIMLLFGRGAFDIYAVSMTSSALFFYSIGMIGYGLRQILTRVFYSIHETKIPMINASISMILNIVLNIILSRYMGIGGLALATSISAIFTTILLFFSLRKRIGQFGIKQISISSMKVLLAACFMGLFAKLSFVYFTTVLSQNMSLLFAILAGAISYFVIIYFMRIEDVDVIIGAVKKKFGRVKD